MFADPSLPGSDSQPAVSPAPGPAPFPEAELQNLAELRRILVGQEQDRLTSLADDIDDLQRLMADKEALAALIAPALDDALRDTIQRNRAEMIEVLHPIIGQTVLRAVSEAIQDLARTVDARVRTTMTPRVLWRRIRAATGGVSGAELALRDALPFEVAEVFVIHRATGLLLRHVTPHGAGAADRDLVGGMLTAIRDFAADALDRSQISELDAIHYGQRHILLETAEYVYLAAVVEGIEPPGFRAQLRDLTTDIENRYRHLLRHYRGDASAFAALDPALATLGAAEEQPLGGRPLSRGQGAALTAAALLLVACVLVVCLGGWWLVETVSRPLPTPVVIYVTADRATLPAATVMPTSTASPTATATPTSTASPTASPTAMPVVTGTPAPLARISVVNARVNVRAGPGLEYPVKLVAEPGATFDLVAQTRDLAWTQVCCLADGATGWIATAFTLPEGITSTP